MQRFGEKLRFLRQQQGLTQQELGDMLALSRVHISNLERGDKKPHADLILQIATIFGVTPNDLMLDELDL